MRKLSSYIIGIAIGAIGFDDTSVTLHNIVRRELEVALSVFGAGYVGNRAFGQGKREYVDPAYISLGVFTGRIFGRYYL